MAPRQRNPDLAALERALARPRPTQLSGRVLARLGIVPERLVPAAVLCGLVEGPGGLEVILTERVAHLRHHAGQISFPGGRMDDGDATPEAAALREAEEEIALLPTAVRPLGRLRENPTLTGFRVTPVVAQVDATARLSPNPDEVAEVFRVPLPWLLDPANRARETRQINGQPITMVRFDWQGHVIWGATATMLMDLIELLTE